MKFEVWGHVFRDIDKTIADIYEDIPEARQWDQFFEDVSSIADSLKTLAAEAKDAGDARRAAIARARVMEPRGKSGGAA